MRTLALASLLIALAFAPEAAGQDAGAAREMGRDGIALFDQGEWAQALDKLKAAEAMFHAPTLVLYIARCEQKLGHLLAARAHYQAIIAERMPADAPEQFRNAKDTAYSELQALDKQIPSLLVIAQGPVTLDGREVDVAAPIRVDPGEHTLTSGGVSRTVSVKAGDGVVRVALAGDEAADEEAPAAGMDAPPEAGDSEGPLWPAITAFAVGGVGLGVGIATGVMAMSKSDEIKSRCIDEVHCLSSDASLGDEAQTLATISTIGFVVGGVGLAAGVVLILVRPGGGDGVALHVAPTGLALTGAF